MMVPNKVDALIEENKKLNARISEIEKRLEKQYKIILNFKSSVERLAKRIENFAVPITVATKEIDLPEHLYKTLKITKTLGGKVTAKEVSDISKRARPVESSYLNQLVRLRIIKKEHVGRSVFFTIIKENQFDGDLKNE